MAVGLLVLSRDAHLVEELRQRFGGRFELSAVDSLEAAQSKLEKAPEATVLAHLTLDMLNGFSPEGFFERLGNLAVDHPLYGLADDRCPKGLRESAERRVWEILPGPGNLHRLAELLEGRVSSAVDPAAYGQGLPRRVLAGRKHALVTFCPGMFTLVEELKVAAAHDVTVPIIGESGSGKTYLARLIHEVSPRRDRSFVSVGCGALPPGAFERGLFGQARGMLPGVDGARSGGRGIAIEGTLLLSEIDSLGLDQQAKLLRIIEECQDEPAGVGQTCHAGGRLILTSGIPLETLVQAGRFRSDLYYRLNTLSFILPPLRERTEDIEYLARRFAVEQSRIHRIELKGIEEPFFAALRQYLWPGNIRELEAVMRRAVLYSREGFLTPANLPPSLRSPASGRAGGNDRPACGSPVLVKWENLGQQVDGAERQIIEESLRRHNYHRIRTARELGISRVTLYNKMKKFGMLRS